MSELRVAGAARARYELGPPTSGDPRGHLTLDPPTARRLAATMNRRRATEGEPPAVPSGDLLALGLLHSAWHVVLVRTLGQRAERLLTDAAAAADGALGLPVTTRVEKMFDNAFPTGRSGPTPPPRPTTLTELYLVSLVNENPALGPTRDLVDDTPLATDDAYRAVIAQLEQRLAGEGGVGPGGLPLPDLLRAPMRAAPTSLAGQLRWIRENWAQIVPPDLLDRLTLGLDVLAEEGRALHLRFGGPAGPAEAPSYAGLDAEPERFSWDSEWMPRLILLAKHTYVWLDQLSRRHGREIRTLDAIPDEELDRLAAWGITGLWLIGLWRRSHASQRIKQMRGNPDAAASAYALDDYALAEDLGGEGSWWNLRERAWARGIRLAADMVPNHMGIDSRWVIEHPEWFLSVPEPPFPSYTFTGENLSRDERVQIRLEDHYWDKSDAAVVFQRVDTQTDDVRYVYHGNDGTSFPWNDTAQIDFSKADVREQVIQTILDVARRFPVIRFDAAMVLARRHVRRLWFPEPGAGGGIPSRAEHAIPPAEWERLMPTEFWRDVVDRVAREVPDTLLLAEAFWLLEGYFVRTLGMHRVYNSAFMHMLRDEQNAEYRKVIRDTLEFDPEILGRYVNFMTNPDEEPAVEGFGKGDKYFGAATLLATLPGLPMLGHGQIEGYGEKYGQEFRRPTLDERPDQGLVGHHEQVLFPVLHRRSWFAGSRDFLLYDFVTESGAVDENVYAYSNGSGPTRSLVVYHNRYATTAGLIRESVAYVEKAADGSKRLVRRTLADALGLPSGGDADGLFLTFRDQRSGLQFIRPATAIRDDGMWFELDAYRCRVLWEFAEASDATGAPWSELAQRLGRRGVPSLDDALRDLVLEPVHAAVRRALEAVQPEQETAALYRLLTEHAPSLDGATADKAVERLVALPSSTTPKDPDERATFRAWAILADIDARTFDDLRLAHALDGTGADAQLVRAALVMPRPSTLGGPTRTLPSRLVEAWLADDQVRSALGVNTWQDVTYLTRERFEALLGLVVVADAVTGGAKAERAAGTLADKLRTAAEAAGYRVDRLRESLGPKPAATARSRRARS
jgi:glycosidase